MGMSKGAIIEARRRVDSLLTMCMDASKKNYGMIHWAVTQIRKALHREERAASEGGGGL